MRVWWQYELFIEGYTGYTRGMIFNAYSCFYTIKFDKNSNVMSALYNKVGSFIKKKSIFHTAIREAKF